MFYITSCRDPFMHYTITSIETTVDIFCFLSGKISVMVSYNQTRCAESGKLKKIHDVIDDVTVFKVKCS